MPPYNPRVKGDEGEGGAGERWIAPFFRDSTLWPVATVAVASGVTLGAALQLLAFRDGNRIALAGLGILALASVELLVRAGRRRRLGLDGAAVLGWWLLSSAAAGAFIWIGIF